VALRLFQDLLQFNAALKTSLLRLKISSYQEPKISTVICTFYLCFLVLSTITTTFYVPIQINQPTRCNSFTSLLLDVYVWLNMFRASPHPLSGAYNCTSSLWFYRWREAAEALFFVVCQTTTNNAATTTL
jgi:hypothetical protein